MKEFFGKIIQKLKRIFIKKTNSSEEIIKKYQKVKIDAGWSSGDKLNYSLKNYAKDFLETVDFSQFSLKLWELSESNERSLLVMIMGEFKTGKSTFINAILGKEVLKSDVTPATAVVTMISYSEKEKLVAHFQNGESKEYSIEMLDKLTAEGDDSKKSLRSTIKYVELQLPLELLRKITLIDTPGLNVDNELHIKATKQFMYEADMVLWVFAYGKTASRTELASISELGERLKPIAIINRIDEIDEEEETLEDVLAEIRKRLKTSVKDVFGVSSFLANKGIKDNNQQLLTESGWSNFSKTFDHEIVNQAAFLKKRSLETKAEELAYSLNEYIGSLKKDLDYLHVKFNDKGKFETEIKQGIGFLQQGITNARKIIVDESLMDSSHIRKLLEANDDNFYITQDYLSGLKKMKNVILKLQDSEKILENVDMYDQIGKDTEKRMKKLIIDFEKFSKSLELHNADVEIHEKNLEAYNNSGFFGGAPLFDWDGRGKQINRSADAINNNLAQLQNTQSNLITRLESFTSRIARQNKELYDYINKLINIMEREIANKEKELVTINNDYDENMRHLNKRYGELGHAQKFLMYIDNKVLKTSSQKTVLTMINANQSNSVPFENGKTNQVITNNERVTPKVNNIELMVDDKLNTHTPKNEPTTQIQVSDFKIEDKIRLNNGIDYVIKDINLSQSGKNYQITLRSLKDGKELKKLFAYFDPYHLDNGVYIPLRNMNIPGQSIIDVYEQRAK
jgi:GTPase Era involved in 16S rRNA processing